MTITEQTTIGEIVLWFNQKQVDAKASTQKKLSYDIQNNGVTLHFFVDRIKFGPSKGEDFLNCVAGRKNIQKFFNNKLSKTNLNRFGLFLQARCKDATDKFGVFTTEKFKKALLNWA